MDPELLTVILEICKPVSKLVGAGYSKLKGKITNASHKYNENYENRHGQLKVCCAGMRKPISLDEVYVAVQFLDEQTALRYKSPKEIEEAFQKRRGRYFNSSERQDGVQVANKEQYLMLLGGPGVGKSTFLRKLGREALKEKEKNVHFKHKCMPVFLELKRFTEAQIDIKTLIAREFEVCGYPHPDQMTDVALEKGKLLILFDGLDEVPRANIDNVIRTITDFVDQHSQNRFIASCRIAAYS